MTSGPHLDEFIDKTLPQCSFEQIQKALKIISDNKNSSNCPRWKKCHKVRYEISLKNIVYINGTRLWIKYEDTEVEHHLNYVSYDIFSLIGEIGGYLGLTLGFSGVSVTLALRKVMCPSIE